MTEYNEGVSELLQMCDDECWADLERQIIIEEMFANLTADYPDWESFVDSEDYQEWIEEYDIHAEKLITEVNEEVARALFNLYLEERQDYDETRVLNTPGGDGTRSASPRRRAGDDPYDND